MRFMVMAAERAPTMATMIQKICQAMVRAAGQSARPECSASKAATRAKGSAKTECSNLIISSTVRMRLWLGTFGANFWWATGSSLAMVAALPVILVVLREIEMREDAVDVLRDDIVDGFWRVVKSGSGGHDERAGVVKGEHV